MSAGQHRCALDGGANEIDPEFDEDDGYWSNPPEGGTAIYVMRHDAERLEFEFCSEQHLAQRMQAPLPPATSVASEVHGSWRTTLGLVLALLALAAIFLTGLVTSIRFAVGLA